MSSCVLNYLVSTLPDASRRRIERELEPTDLHRDFVIASRGHEIEFTYFLDAGIGSVTLTNRKGQVAEAGMFGREGASPTALAAGGYVSLYDIAMQSDGRGHRIDSRSLIALLAEDRELENLFLRYIHVFATQVSFTALSNAVDRLGVRLSRWLLMCHDRVDGDEIEVTHDYLALMLGVRRASVTIALHELEGRRLIRSKRGVVIIRDRGRLLAHAGDAYGEPEREYRRVVQRELEGRPEQRVSA
jgi:CRP-like cAMP-binding protein